MTDEPYDTITYGPDNMSNAVCDDSVDLNALGAEWDLEEYTDKKTGQKRVRLTRRT